MKSLILFFLIISINLFSQNTQSEYLDTNYPEDDPKLFAESIFSTFKFSRCLFVSADKLEYFFVPSYSNGGSTKILCLKRNDKSEYSLDTIVDAQKRDEFAWCTEPWLSYDGTQLFFAANKDIWKMERKQGVWGNPIKMGENINSDWIEFHPSISLNGNLYFHSRKDRNSEIAIYCSKLKNGVYQPRIKIVDLEGDAGDPAIAPDESFLVFASDRGKARGGDSDLYISFYMKGKWTSPKSLGSKVNTDEIELAPRITSDGRFLFFYRRDNWSDATYSKNYWVDINKVIEVNKLEVQ